MTITAKRFAAGSQLTAAATTYYTAPANTKAVVKQAELVNTTGAAVTCTVYVIPSGGAANAANTVISARSIAPGEAYPCPELVNQVLEAGGFIQALGLNVSFNASGIEIV